LLAHVEQDNSGKAEVVGKVEGSDYADLFEKVNGSGAFDDVDAAFDSITAALQAYEKSSEVNQFSSKYDAVQAGNAEFTESEQRGSALFSMHCTLCHDDSGDPVIFTGHRYVNLGVPKNPNNAWYTEEQNPDGADFIDLGLGPIVDDTAENGAFKIPTLRNVALSQPYMHNGVFATLEEVVHFYNGRDTGDFGEPEVADNQTDLIGNMGLADGDVDDIVAFMETLTDGFEP
jgi:cytochrome c peroxidase